MKHYLTPTLSRLGGYLAQLERQHASDTYTQPFREALGALERLRALQEEAPRQNKRPYSHTPPSQANRGPNTTPEGYI